MNNPKQHQRHTFVWPMREVLLVINSEINENIHGEEIVSPCVLQKQGTSRNK